MDSNDAEASESEGEVYDKSLKPTESLSQRSNDANTDAVNGTKSQKVSTPPKKSQSVSPSKSAKSPKKSPIGMSFDNSFNIHT